MLGIPFLDAKYELSTLAMYVKEVQTDHFSQAIEEGFDEKYSSDSSFELLATLPRMNP